MCVCVCVWLCFFLVFVFFPAGAGFLWLGSVSFLLGGCKQTQFVVFATIPRVVKMGHRLRNLNAGDAFDLERSNLASICLLIFPCWF